MANRESGSSSEDNLSDESDLNLVNLYKSDIENSVVPVENSGPRPYRFVPQRVGQNEQQASSRTIWQQLRLSWKHRLVHVFYHFANKLHF